MASEIRVNTFKNRSGLGTITVNDTGANFSGIVTATSFSGDGGYENSPEGYLGGAQGAGGSGIVIIAYPTT